MAVEGFDLGSEVREMTSKFTELAEMAGVSPEVVAFYIRREVVAHKASWRTVYTVARGEIAAGIGIFAKPQVLREQLAVLVGDALKAQLSTILGSCDTDQDGGKRIPAWLVRYLDQRVSASWTDYYELDKDYLFETADQILRLVAE